MEEAGCVKIRIAEEIKGLLTLKELSDKIKIPVKAIRELEKRKMINSLGDFIDKFSEILKEGHYEG